MHVAEYVAQSVDGAGTAVRAVGAVGGALWTEPLALWDFSEHGNYASYMVGAVAFVA